MRVPLIFADRPLDVTRVPNAGAGAYARSGIGAISTDIASDFSKQEAILREKERVAQETLKAIDLDNKLSERSANIKDSFLKRSDSENFDGDLKSQIQSMRDEYTPQNASPELTQAFARSLNRHTQNISDTVSAMKYRVMEEQGRIAIGQYVDNASNEYAATDDPTQKSFIKKGAELRIRGAINSNLVNPVWGENQIREFERVATAKEADKAEAIIIDRMGTDPAQLAIDLKDKKYLPALTDESKRATLGRQAETAARIQENEREQKRKQIETELHDKEERTVGNLYMTGDYSKAYAMVLGSNMLKGDEKATWANAIKNAQKVKIDEIDPMVETTEIRTVNEMISKDKPVNEIRDYIIQSPNLRRGNKEQYLNKIDTDYNTEMKDRRTLGLNTIKDQIIPKRGLTSAILETPMESSAVAKAQLDFLDWFDEQTKTGKRITRTEAFYKSQTIASQYQVSIAEQIGFLQSEGKRIQEEMKKVNKK